MITIHVTMTFKPEFTKVAKKLLKKLKKASRQEFGCEGYSVKEDVNDENTIVIIEKFYDDAALAFHRETEHVKDILKEQLTPMINEKVVRFLK